MSLNDVYYIDKYSHEKYLQAVIDMRLNSLAQEEGDALGYPLLDAKRSIIMSLSVSKEAFVVIDKSKPKMSIVAVFGITMAYNHENKPVGWPWFVHNGFLPKSSFRHEFLRRSKETVNVWMKDYFYSKLETNVMKTNVKSVKWLKWLGFKEIGRKTIDWTNKNNIRKSTEFIRLVKTR